MRGYGNVRDSFTGGQRNIFIAIEITNNSPEVQDLEFLGLYHRQKMNPALTLRSIVGEKLCVDNELRDIIDLQCFTSMINAGFVFYTSMLHDMFKDKVFKHKEINHLGQQYLMPHILYNYTNPLSACNQIVEVESNSIIKAGTSFHQSHIQPGERLVIFFVSNRHQGYDYLQALIDKANRIFNKDKQRKILLTL